MKLQVLLSMMREPVLALLSVSQAYKTDWPSTAFPRMQAAASTNSSDSTPKRADDAFCVDGEDGAKGGSAVVGDHGKAVLGMQL